MASITKSLWIVFMVCSLMSHLVNAQYGGYGGHAGEGQEVESVEERPRVNLGIRLRIPAMKFELPRLSMPKITVTAKIRQPEGPRVINLPEINFDTTNKVEGGGGGGGGGSGSGGGYKYSSSASQYPGPSYGMATGSYGESGGGGGGQTGSFTFTTEGEEQHTQSATGDYANNKQYYQQPKTTRPSFNYYYRPSARNNKQQASNYQRPYQLQQQQQQSSAGQYSSSISRPMYSVYNRPPGGPSQAYQYHKSGSHLDLEFNPPVHVTPSGSSYTQRG